MITSKKLRSSMRLSAQTGGYDDCFSNPFDRCPREHYDENSRREIQFREMKKGTKNFEEMIEASFELEKNWTGFEKVVGDKYEFYYKN